MGVNQTRPKRRMIIGVLSANSYDQRRAACRQTWVAEAAAHPEVEVVFILGGGPKLQQTFRTEDILMLPCEDDYASLPQKTCGFLKWALENFDFQVAFKCDDDTFVHFRRLIEYQFDGHDYVGADIGGYASGGAGYSISARAASALVPALERVMQGPEDLIVGELLRKGGFELRGSGLFGFDYSASLQPGPANPMITAHWVRPDTMLQMHASLTEPAFGHFEFPFQILDWKTGWGVLGLNGALGHEVDGATDIKLPQIELDWERYHFISGHVDCRIDLRLERPAGIFGFIEGHSWNLSESPVTFSVDGDVLGVLSGPGERTAESRLPAGHHVFHMITPGNKTRRYPVWAVRQLAELDSFRIVIPTSNGYTPALRNALELLQRYWPDHPPVDIVHHEQTSLSPNVRQFFAGPQSEVSWCEAMARYLTEANQDELVLLLLNDYGLCQPVDTVRVAAACDLMCEDLSVAAFYLTWMMLPEAVPHHGREDVILWPRWEYSVNTQAALWRTASLLRLLRLVGQRSIGAFELEASRIFNEQEFSWEKHVSFRLPEPASPNLFLDSCDKTHWPIGYHNLYHRGQLDLRHVDFLHNHGLEVRTSLLFGSTVSE